jgi:4-hydroxybenzoyl-CoA reductase subunit beta
MKQGLLDPVTLVALAGVAELGGLRVIDNGLRIGAMTSLRQVAEHPHVQARFPALARAARGVATSTIQRMGTLGGNLMLDTRCRFYNQSTFGRRALDTQAGGCLKCSDQGACHVAPKGQGCYAAHSADTVPVLWLLDARVELASADGTRTVPVARLYDSADGRWWLRTRAGEILVAVHLPRPTGAVVQRKLRSRGAIDYPLLLTAVRVDDQGGGVVISSVGPAPQEIPGVSGLIAERRFDEVAQLASKAVQPLATHVRPAWWRKRMVRVEVKRALDEALALHVG